MTRQYSHDDVYIIKVDSWQLTWQPHQLISLSLTMSFHDASLCVMPSSLEILRCYYINLQVEDLLREAAERENIKQSESKSKFDRLLQL